MSDIDLISTIKPLDTSRKRSSSLYINDNNNNNKILPLLKKQKTIKNTSNNNDNKKNGDTQNNNNIFGLNSMINEYKPQITPTLPPLPPIPLSLTNNINDNSIDFSAMNNIFNNNNEFTKFNPINNGNILDSISLQSIANNMITPNINNNNNIFDMQCNDYINNLYGIDFRISIVKDIDTKMKQQYNGLYNKFPWDEYVLLNFGNIDTTPEVLKNTVNEIKIWYDTLMGPNTRSITDYLTNSTSLDNDINLNFNDFIFDNNNNNKPSIIYPPTINNTNLNNFSLPPLINDNDNEITSTKQETTTDNDISIDLDNLINNKNDDISSNYSNNSEDKLNNNKKCDFGKYNDGMDYPLEFRVKMVQIIELIKSKKNSYVKWSKLVRNHVASFHKNGIFNKNYNAVQNRARVLQRWYRDKNKIFDEYKKKFKKNPPSFIADNLAQYNGNRSSFSPGFKQNNNINNNNIDNNNNNNNINSQTPSLDIDDPTSGGYEGVKKERNDYGKYCKGGDYPLSFRIEMIKRIESMKQQKVGHIKWNSLVRNHMAKYHRIGLFDGNYNAIQSRARILQRWYKEKDKIINEYKKYEKKNKKKTE